MKKRFLFFCFLGIFILLSGPYLKGSERQKSLTIDLFLDWESVADPQISPDGTQIVFVKRITDKVNDKYENELWIINFDGSRERQLGKGSSPRWSPDGKRLAYISSVDNQSQIFVRWMDTGEATQITRLDQSPNNLAWSPDGKKIAFTMLVPFSPPSLIQMPSKPKGAKWSDPPVVVERLNYRFDGRGSRPLGFNHIFTVPSTGGTPGQLTSGDYDHGAFDWSKDSQTIVFSATRKPDPDYLAGGSEVYSLSLKDGEIRALTDRDGADANPKFSPSGKFIAYSGYDQKNYSYQVSHLYLMDSDGGNKRPLSNTFDLSIQDYIWAFDGSGLYFTVDDKGTSNIYFASLSGNIKQITQGAQVVRSLSLSPNSRAAAVLSSAWEPGDIVALSLKQPGFNKITSVNADLLEGRKLGEVEEIWYKSFDDKMIQGWVIKPPDFDPSKKYPLILYIHGGPHAMYDVSFNFEFQNHAAHGYVVLYTNPRGSTGYGEEFGNAIWYSYPGDDYKDLMKGVDALLEKGYIDEQNLFVCGGSGGGVLTSWIVGHTDRFRAAVVMKPVTNWYSFVGTTDGASWYRSFRKMPWENPQEYLDRSSISYVGNVTTPTMILTGELDLRTPMEQTEQYYRALKIQKKDTVMVRIPGEFHGIGSIHPTHRIAQILYLRYWFDKYKK